MDKKDAKWYETSAQTRLDSARSVSDYRGVFDDCNRGLNLCNHETVACVVCAELRLIRAQACMGLKDFSEALEDCTSALDLGGEEIKLCEVRARANLCLGNLKEVFAICKYGLDLDSNNVEFFAIRAEAYISKNTDIPPIFNQTKDSDSFSDHSKAFKDCNEGLGIDCTNANLYAMRARAHLYFEDYDHALKDSCYAIKWSDIKDNFYGLRAHVRQVRAMTYKNQEKKSEELDKVRADRNRALELAKEQEQTDIVESMQREQAKLNKSNPQ